MTQSRCNTALQRDLRAAADALSHNSLRVPSLLRDAANRLDEQEKMIAELRALLETATDAWLDGAQLWRDSKLYADYKQAALSKDWYEKARKLITDETAS